MWALALRQGSFLCGKIATFVIEYNDKLAKVYSVSQCRFFMLLMLTIVDTQLDKLHVLEVATFWGATQAYFLRGYTERLSVNSFPCECFSLEETNTYADYFGRDKDILIIESLEYPRYVEEVIQKKRAVASVGSSQLALDDYGVGFNDMTMVEKMDSQIIKIDRSLLSGINADATKQENCKNIIEKMHTLGKRVVAEGVETKEEFDYLVSIGADLFQGYYLARPA